jgi:peptidyl-dipeptidase A
VSHRIRAASVPTPPRRLPFAPSALAFALVACGARAPAPTMTPAPAPVLAPPPVATVASPPPPTAEEARAFMDDVEANLRRLWVARDRANWVNENFITDDTEALSAAGEEATAAYVGDAIARSKRFDSIRAQLPADLARKFYLLTLAQTIPSPSDPHERSELAGIEAWMTGAYGKGQYCPAPASPLFKEAQKAQAQSKSAAPCLHLEALSRILAKSRDYAQLVDAWRGWHATAAPMKEKYARYVELANEGAKEIGFDDVGALWRAGYDMTPAEFEADIERLWSDVKPLYDELHCYVRARLQAKYGKEKVPDHAPIPAQLLGNMWAQEWNNIADIVTPYPDEPPLDVGKALEAGHWDAVKMVKQGERFFTGLGFDPLPKTFWERSLFTRPRDREVVCHASAWDVTWSGDLRVKVCLEPTEEDFVTIHHELGHNFYFQRYERLPILFQQGANDGFHEAIGDTIALSVTPAYSRSLSLLPPAHGSAGAERALINEQMKMALEKVAFLPFGLLIDKWRWDVFSGKVPPADYNAAWWRLKEKYQGVSAPVPRNGDDFDPGAKFHVASSTPYVRYFLARIYQFQFHRALCQAAGATGPLYECSIHDNKQAGERLMTMLSLGASRPWPDALETIGAGRTASAQAMLEYFEPLRKWLAEQNKGRQCGW